MYTLQKHKKTFLSLVIIGLLLFGFADVAFAQSSAGISFGIRPTKALESQKETFSYFSYRVSTGTSFEDEALILNDGSETVTLKLYAADGFTSKNGGTDFTKQGEESAGFSRGSYSWISLPYAELTLAPGEERLVPFQVNIPADASSGDHVAGLVVEALPQKDMLDTPQTNNGNNAQFAVEVIRRVGVAVVMAVDGERNSSLVVEDIFLYQQSDEGTTFAVDISNTGNTFIQPEGFFVVTDRTAENLITTIPLQFETILPGDSVTFYVPRSAHFEDGEYLLSVLLECDGKKSTLEGVGMKIKKGQPEIEGVISNNIFSAEEIEVFFAKPAHDPRTIWIIAGVVTFIFAFVLSGYIYWAGGKTNKVESLR